MKKTLSILSLFFLVIFQACKNDENIQIPVVDNQYYTTTNNGINIFKEDAIQYIQEDVVNDSLIVFSANSPDDLLPKIGSTIFIPISGKTPSGFLGKILSIEKGNPIKVFTESAPLEEVFQNLSIDTTLVDVISNVENIVDAEGNPIDFEIIDTLLKDTIDAASNSKITRAGGYWQGGVIKFPFTIAKGEDGHKLTGLLYVDVKNFNFNIDIVNNEISYFNFRADPTIKVIVKDETKIIETNKDTLEKRTLIGTVNCAPITIPTPIFVPIILRPKLYLYLVYGVQGSIKASIGLQYQTSFECEMIWKNKQWNNRFSWKGPKNEKPWTVTEFDVSGEVYLGSKMGLLVGFYSATTGVGVNITPKFSLETNAKLSTENLLDINPEIGLSAKWSGDLYFTASLFKRPIAHYSFSTPEYVVWSEKMYLLPQFANFEAIGSSSSGEVDYQIDSHYFLSVLGVKTGTQVYDSDKKTVIGTYYPTPTKTDNKGVKYYNVDIEGLSPGKTYYAAPIASLFNFAWPSGQKHEFTTEAKYNLGFRCVGQSYDVINFSFDLNNKTGNVIDYTTEATDYDGSPMRVHITATYNSSNQTLNGVFDFYFYDDPSQQRKDGFSVSLATDDSGYVNCSKVIDNGGCYTALRIYKSSSQTARKNYAAPLVNDDCNIGIYNKNHTK